MLNKTTIHVVYLSAGFISESNCDTFSVLPCTCFGELLSLERLVSIDLTDKSPKPQGQTLLLPPCCWYTAQPPSVLYHPSAFPPFPLPPANSLLIALQRAGAGDVAGELSLMCMCVGASLLPLLAKTLCYVSISHLTLLSQFCSKRYKAESENRPAAFQQKTQK